MSDDDRLPSSPMKSSLHCRVVSEAKTQMSRASDVGLSPGGDGDHREFLIDSGRLVYLYLLVCL